MAAPKLTPDQISHVSGLVADYISTQRQKYTPRAVPLSGQRAAVAAFFAPEMLGNTRLLVLREERVPNPDFYPMLRNLGFKNLPDQSAMAAITFCDVVVSHEPFSNELLFHELVHVEQYRQLGIPRFSELTHLRDGPGLLESTSDEVVVYRSGHTIRTETLDDKSLGSFQLSDACRVRVLAAEKLFVNDCKGPRIVDYNGKKLMRFRRLRNWDHFELDSSADGERLLFNHFSGKMSVFRAAGEVLVAFATAGMGANDEADNREQVEVLDINTGESCFDLHQGFAKGSESSSRSAFISPSGQYVAIVAGSSLSIYGLPATCKSKK